MGILDGKRILVTGVLMESSIAFHVARIAQQEGAELVLTSFGRTMRITQTIAKRLPTPPPVIELDASNAEDFDALADRVREHVDGLDGVLHSIGFAPEAALGGNFLKTEWADVATAVLDDDLQKTYKSQIPLGRFCSADEVARVVRFVASDDAAYITGAVVPVDGGLGMGH